MPPHQRQQGHAGGRRQPPPPPVRLDVEQACLDAIPGNKAIRDLMYMKCELLEETRPRQDDRPPDKIRTAKIKGIFLKDLPNANLSLAMGRLLPADCRLGDAGEKLLPADLSHNGRSWKVENPDAIKLLRMELLRTIGNQQGLSAEAFAGLRARRKNHANGSNAFNLMTDTRLLVGFGNKNTAEMGLTVHPLYGFPIIPGSSLKGAARQYLRECKKWLKPSVVATIAQKARQSLGHAAETAPPPGAARSLDELEEILFGPARVDGGGDGNSGALVFHDAWPAEQTEWYDVDIMNPHYTEYYMDDKWPGDYLNPVPLQFLCVRAGVKFEFMIGVTCGGLQEKIVRKGRTLWQARPAEDIDLLQLLGIFLLRGALQDYGVGAKRAADYGFFRDA